MVESCFAISYVSHLLWVLFTLWVSSANLFIDACPSLYRDLLFDSYPREPPSQLATCHSSISVKVCWEIHSLFSYDSAFSASSMAANSFFIFSLIDVIHSTCNSGFSYMRHFLTQKPGKIFMDNEEISTLLGCLQVYLYMSFSGNNMPLITRLN